MNDSVLSKVENVDYFKQLTEKELHEAARLEKCDADPKQPKRWKPDRPQWTNGGYDGNMTDTY